MDSGLRIYNVDPLVEKAHFDNDLMGSISMAEMLWRTNVIAVVGGGNRAKFADNTVLLYDDLSKKFVMEVTFTSLIKAVRLRRDKYGTFNNVDLFKNNNLFLEKHSASCKRYAVLSRS